MRTLRLRPYRPTLIARSPGFSMREWLTRLLIILGMVGSFLTVLALLHLFLT